MNCLRKPNRPMPADDQNEEGRPKASPRRSTAPRRLAIKPHATLLQPDVTERVRHKRQIREIATMMTQHINQRKGKLTAARIWMLANVAKSDAAPATKNAITALP